MRKSTVIRNYNKMEKARNTLEFLEGVFINSLTEAIMTEEVKRKVGLDEVFLDYFAGDGYGVTFELDHITITMAISVIGKPADKIIEMFNKSFY